MYSLTNHLSNKNEYENNNWKTETCLEMRRGMSVRSRKLLLSLHRTFPNQQNLRNSLHNIVNFINIKIGEGSLFSKKQ